MTVPAADTPGPEACMVGDEVASRLVPGRVGPLRVPPLAILADLILGQWSIQRLRGLIEHFVGHRSLFVIDYEKMAPEA